MPVTVDYESVAFLFLVSNPAFLSESLIVVYRTHVIHVAVSQSFYVHHIYTKAPPPFPSLPLAPEFI